MNNQSSDSKIQPRSAILLLSCPDRAGIVARVSHFIFERQGNIISFDQHVDSEQSMLFMRVEWTLQNFTIPYQDLEAAFSPLAKEFQAEWRIEFTELESSRVALFVSKHLHCFQDLLWRQQTGELPCEIALVISNHLDAKGMAEDRQIPFFHFPIDQASKAEQEIAQVKLLTEKKVSLVVLARYMQILSESFLANYTGSIINIHHSFLPAFVGGSPYKQALVRGVKIIGATSHYATADLDEGPIIEQDIIRISHKDSLQMLVRKGRDLERVVLARAVRWHLEHRVLPFGSRTIVFEG